MSGHSKWSTIKRKKGANDAVRGKIFAKISKEIMIAVREGGGDPNANTRLRTAMIKAHSENMPNSNIDRAIKKAMGAGEQDNFEEIVYEGYAMGGVAVLVECLTDNKNRTGPEVRHVFSRNGGNLGEKGCVSYMFEKKGSILIAKKNINEDDVFELVIRAGAEDVLASDDGYEISTSIEKFSDTIKALEDAKCEIEHAEIAFVPDSYIEVSDEETVLAVQKLLDAMDELDDVQAVSHNFDQSTKE